MKRCPKCNCEAEFTNKSDYYSEEAFGVIIGGITVVVTEPFTHRGVDFGKGVYKDLTDNNYRHYKCTNPECNYGWIEK